MNDKKLKNSLDLNVEGSGNGFASQANTQRQPGEVNSKEENSTTPINKETYKSIPEDNLPTGPNNLSEQTPPPVIEVKMVQGDDGADEQMLGKKDEVKFIKGDQQNGDAKIDIGTVKKITALSRDELMKYANDPFWIKIRWFFFILFWLVWVGMLVLSILIIINAPKCSAPSPLKWYQQGPFAFFKNVDEVTPGDVAVAKKIYATGAIYKLPAEETYSVKDPKVEEKIKKLIDTFKASDIKVILDITPNYVNKESPMLKDALSDETKRSAFIWLEKAEKPNNWLSITNKSAWEEINTGNFVLSQFGDGLYDLRMNDTIVKKELKASLQHLLNLGVHGFRLNNTKYYLVNPTFEDEQPGENPNFIHTDYGFWTHSHTTFQEGLGEVLYEYMVAVKNVSAEAFLSINEDTINPEVYRVNTGEFGIDLPIYGRFPHVLGAPDGKDLYAELQDIFNNAGNTTWLQWNLELSNSNPSAYSLFMSMMPGVQVIAANSPVVNLTEATLRHINSIRSSASYMHGDFDLYRANGVVAYTRFKSGNPGYIVAFNPSEKVATADFSAISGLPEKMSVDYFSDNFNVTGVEMKGRLKSNSVELSPRSTAIYTYVPAK